MLDMMIDLLLKRKHHESVLGCLTGKIRIGPSPAELQQALDDVCQQIRTTMQIPDIAKLQRIEDTRTAYKACGKDPVRYRNSCESMMRRCIHGKDLYHVNNAVDINNLVSLRTGFSLGLYDLAKLQGPLTWTVAPAGAHYDGIGRESLNIEFLPALSDDLGFFGNPTSDSSRSMISESTEDFLLCIFSFSGSNELDEILAEIQDLMTRYCDGRVMVRRIVE